MDTITAINRLEVRELQKNQSQGPQIILSKVTDLLNSNQSNQQALGKEILRIAIEYKFNRHESNGRDQKNLVLLNKLNKLIEENKSSIKFTAENLKNALSHSSYFIHYGLPKEVKDFFMQQKTFIENLSNTLSAGAKEYICKQLGIVNKKLPSTNGNQITIIKASISSPSNSQPQPPAQVILELPVSSQILIKENDFENKIITPQQLLKLKDGATVDCDNAEIVVSEDDQEALKELLNKNLTFVGKMYVSRKSHINGELVLWIVRNKHYYEYKPELAQPDDDEANLSADKKQLRQLREQGRQIVDILKKDTECRNGLEVSTGILKIANQIFDQPDLELSYSDFMGLKSIGFYKFSGVPIYIDKAGDIEKFITMVNGFNPSILDKYFDQGKITIITIPDQMKSSVVKFKDTKNFDRLELK